MQRRRAVNLLIVEVSIECVFLIQTSTSSSNILQVYLVAVIGLLQRARVQQF